MEKHIIQIWKHLIKYFVMDSLLSQLLKIYGPKRFMYRVSRFFKTKMSNDVQVLGHCVELISQERVVLVERL